MPTLHETTRKRICRIGFFLLCLAPTVATGGWIASHYWPGTHERLETAIAERLRVTPKLSPRETPKPGLTRFTSATLADFAAAHQVELREVDGLSVVQINQVRLQLESLSELLKVAQREWESPIAQSRLIRINELKIASNEAQSDSKTITLRKVRFQLDHSGLDDLRRVRLAAEVGEEGTEISALIQQQADGTWKAKLDASQTALPVQLVSQCATVLRGLTGEFQGTVQWSLSPNGVRGVIAGNIVVKDLNELLPERFLGQARGVSYVKVDELAFRSNQIEKLDARLQVEHGELGEALFKALQADLKFQPVFSSLHRPGITPQMVYPFDKIAARIELNHRGLTVSGDFPEDAGKRYARVMVRNGEALMLQPDWMELTCAYWVRFCVGDTPVSMPVSREAIELARRLPSPSEVKPEKK